MRLTLLQRALLANLAVFGVAFLLLLFSPVTVSAPIRGHEALILAVGFVALLLINLALVRRALLPLEQLEHEMATVDLRNPDRSLVDDAAQIPELASFIRAFNAMLDRLTEERRAGARAALSAQEGERLRIARALHDEAGQTLTAIALELERTAEDAIRPDVRQRMTALVAEIHDTLEEIRRITRELRPEALDDLGLHNALIALSSRVARQGGLQIDRQLSPELPPLSKELELVIYRVAQEALTNVLRHASASRCTLQLSYSDGLVRLEVTDDGIGLPDRPPEDTIGLEGMRERALLVHGQLAVESRPGSGTTVTLAVPAAVSDDVGARQ